MHPPATAFTAPGQLQQSHTSTQGGPPEPHTAVGAAAGQHGDLALRPCELDGCPLEALDLPVVCCLYPIHHLACPAVDDVDRTLVGAGDEAICTKARQSRCELLNGLAWMQQTSR